MDSVYTLASELLNKHEEDWDKAAEEVVNVILSDPILMQSFARPLITKAVKDIVIQVVSRRRSNAFNPKTVPTLPKGVSGETLQAPGAAEAQYQLLKEVLLDIWLNNAKKLFRTARMSDLALEVNMYADNGMFNDRKCQFFKIVHDRLGSEERCVEDKFTEAELEKIWDSVCRRTRRRWNKKRVAQESHN